MFTNLLLVICYDNIGHIKMDLRTCLLIFCWSFVMGHAENNYYTETGKLCILCPPGFFHIDDCDIPNTIAVCKPCPVGTYSKFYNRAIHCQTCMPHCESDVLVTVQECNTTHDMVCDCPHGEILENPMDKFHAKCKPFKGCGPGSGVIERGKPGHEPVCADCRPGITFSLETSWHEPCYPCTKCPYDDVWQECNATHDSICNIPRQTWREDVAVPSIVFNAVLLAAFIILFIIEIYRRCFRKERNTPENVEEEEARRPLNSVPSNNSSDSGLDQHSIQMEDVKTNWTLIFQMVSRHITVNWKEVIRSLFHAIGVDECDSTIQELHNNNQPIQEQIYQCLKKWQHHQTETSDSTDVLIRILTEKSYLKLVRKLQTDFPTVFTMNPATT